LYEYIDCAEKLEEICLPPRESFYSSLTGDTESNYAHTTNVLQRFSIQMLEETDVSLLADIFENFRDGCVASYRLDPAYYYSIGFYMGRDVKILRINFELLTDINMIMFIERDVVWVNITINDKRSYQR